MQFCLLFGLLATTISCSQTRSNMGDKQNTSGAANAEIPPRLIGEVFGEEELPGRLQQALKTKDNFTPAATNPGDAMTWDVPVYSALLPSSSKVDKQVFRRAVNMPKSVDEQYARLRAEVWCDQRKGSDQSPAPGSLQVRVEIVANPAQRPMSLSGPILVVETGNPLTKRGANYEIDVNKVWLPEPSIQDDKITAYGGPPLPAQTWFDVVVHAQIGRNKLPIRLRQVKLLVRK